MQIHPRMTSSGRRWAFLLGLVIAFALPKRVEHATIARCTRYEVEPFGFYLIERAVGRGVGFAYESGDECR